jgi:hypothetical protein
MAESGGLYSLLGQVTTSQYKKDRREERKYRKDIERQRLKAMLLQPVIAGAMNIGKDVIGDVAGNLFLPDGGKDFQKLESSRPFLTKLTAQTTANKDLLALRERLKAPTRVDNMITEAANRQADKLGIGAKDGAYKTILSYAESKRSEFEQTNIDHLNLVRSKLSSLATGTRSATEMVAEIKDIDSKSNFSRIARNLFKGYSPEEASAADRRQVFTGERTKPTIYDAEYEKFQQSSYATDLETEIAGIKSFDAVETKKLLTQIQKDNPAFYGLLDQQAENRVAVLTAATNVQQNAPKGSIVSQFFNSSAGIEAVLKGIPDAFYEHTSTVLEKAIGGAGDAWNRISSSEQGRITITELANNILKNSKVYAEDDTTAVNDRLKEIYSSIHTQLKDATTQLLSDPESLEIVGNLSVEKYSAFVTQFTNDWASRNTKLIKEQQVGEQGWFGSDKIDSGTSDVVLAPNTSETIKSAFFRFIKQDNIDPDTQQPLGYEAIAGRQFRKTTGLIDESLQTIFGNTDLTVEGKMEALEETLLDWASTSLKNNTASIIQNNEVTFDRIKEFANRTYAEMADNLGQTRKGLSFADNEVIFNPMSGFTGMSLTPSITDSRFSDPSSLKFKEIKVEKSSPDYAAKAEQALKSANEFLGVPSSFEKLFNIDLETVMQKLETINGATTLVKKKVIEVTDSPTINRQSTLNEVASNISNRENSEVVLDLAQKWSNFLTNFDAVMNSTDQPTSEPVEDTPASSLLTPSATSRMLEPIDNSLLSRVSEEEETDIAVLLSDALERVSSNDKFRPVPQELFQVVIDIETNASDSLAKRNLAFSERGHAHGIGQIKTAVAVSPGYNVPNIFDTADELGITYDPELKSEAINQQKNNAKNNNGVKDITGDAGKEVIRLLQLAPVNLTMSAGYLSSLYKKYDGDIAKTLLGYNQGPSVADKWDGNIETIPAKKSEGVGYLRKADAILSFLES